MPLQDANPTPSFGGFGLRPVWEFLGTQCTYDELRLARIYLRQEEMLSD